MKFNLYKHLPVIALAISPLPTFAQATPQPEAATPAPAAAEPSRESRASDLVKAEWAKYDAGAKGHLTASEFGQWMSDLHTASGKPAPDAAWQKSAFAKADTMKDGKVSPDELSAYLTAGA